MLTNAKVGTKLLALIVAPVMVLLAVASLGARDRLDEAGAAEQAERAAELTTLTDAAVQSLGNERLLTSAAMVGGGDQGVDQARAQTDEALERLQPAMTSAAGPAGFADRIDQAVRVLGETEDLRASIDGDDADVEVVIDAYGLAIDELVRLEAEVAMATSAAELSLSLDSASSLSRAEEARSALAARGAVAIGLGDFQSGDLEEFVGLQAEQDRFLARFEDGASVAAATDLRDALATPEAVAADAQVEELISDATIGGPGVPQIDLGDWTTGQTRWLETVGVVDRDLVRDVSVAAGDTAFTATKAARLFMIATAGATLLSVLLAIWVARSIDRPLRRLTTAANELASDRLPRLVENLRSPDADAGAVEGLEPIEVLSKDEIGQMTEAFNAIQKVTATVAEEQSKLLHKGIGDIFVNLARRNQSLLDRQIEFIDELESKEQDPDLLQNLFRLDHLATRMRRNAESLLVLAGAEPARRRAKPVGLSDVVRVAIGEVEDFTRVQLLDLDDATVAGNLAVDLSHLLSELMENATHFSPPETAVEVGGKFGSGGSYILTVTDHGIGMSGDDLDEANLLLANPPLVGLALGRSLGFTVVGRIAARLGLRTHLNASPAGGVTAVIALPPDLVARPDEPEPRDPLLDRAPPTDAPAQARVAAPADRSSADAAVVESEAVPVRPPESQDVTVERPAPDLESAPKTAAAGPDPVEPDAGTARPPAPPESEPPPLPRRDADPALAAGQLSEALPEGDDFEQGLASLLGPESSDEDVEQQFWGPLADDDPKTPPPPNMPVESAGPEREPVEGPERVEPDTGSQGLVRRVPGAASAPAPIISPSVDAPRRSPEQVRAMLSRYRDGRKGHQSPASPQDDDSTTEETR